MGKLPSYVGVKAFGIKMGAILPGDDIVEAIYEVAKKCDKDGLIDNGDILCVTESVVARAQNNYVSKEEVGEEVRKKLSLTESDNLGILYPIASRNRFVPLLEGLAKAVYSGKVSIQFSFPRDCVGNQIAPEDLDKQLGRNLQVEEITSDELEEHNFRHPATGVDYISLYKQLIEKEGARSDIFLSNNTHKIIEHKPDGIIVSSIHERNRTLEKIKKGFDNSITLQNLCDDNKSPAWSEWGLLGSNLYSEEQIKLAPRESFEIAKNIQSRINEGMGKEIEVMIYGDGAYMDPSTGIYELADPVCSFGHTDGLKRRRIGIKYKFFVGMLHAQGKERKEIERTIEEKKQETYKIDDDSMEGTTPRKLEDIAASLADLVSGSADAGTPMVIIKGIS
jgi:F420-0:gamma-glutamyl ligase